MKLSYKYHTFNIPLRLLLLLKRHIVFVRAAGGIVSAPDGRMLLILRNGRWDLPKGKVEPGETLLQAALREVQEETGIHGLSPSPTQPSCLAPKETRPATGAKRSGASHPATQPLSHPATQPLSHPATQPLHHSATQPLSPSPTQPLSPSPTQPLPPSPTQPLSHSATQPLSPSPTQPLSHSATQPLPPSPTQPLSHSTTQPLSHSATQPPPPSPTQPLPLPTPLKTYHLFRAPSAWFSGPNPPAHKWHLKQTSWFPLSADIQPFSPQLDEGITAAEWVDPSTWYARLQSSYGTLRTLSSLYKSSPHSSIN